MKEDEKIINILTKEYEDFKQAVKKQLEIECNKCDGTGKPLTKLGKPPMTGHGDIKCSVCYGSGSSGNKLDVIEEEIMLMKKDISKISSNLKAYVNRQFAEIRVVEEDGKWGDYTGVFYSKDEDEEKIVLEKAREHFKTYFKDSNHHRNKKLGIFLYSPRSGKKLIEEIETD